MGLYRQSAITLAQAQARIADSIGASGDTEALARAGYALEAAIQRWNAEGPWKFLQVIAPGIKVIAPFTVASCSSTLNTTTVTSTNNFNTAGVTEGDQLWNVTGIEPETVVASVVATGQISISRATTATITTQTITFTRRDFVLPADFGSIYSVRTASEPRTLRPINQRDYDRSVFDQTSGGSPEAYSLFRVGEVNKIRLYPTPQKADTLIVKYYRLMDQTADPIDVPIDFEAGVLALAKANLIADRGGDESRLQYWSQYAEKAIEMAGRKDQTSPDMDLSFQPGGGGMIGWNPNATQPFIDLLNP